MRTFLLIVLVYVVVLETIFLPSTQCDENLIQQTCKQTPYYNLCIYYIKADPRSTNANVAGLGLIMVDVIKAKAIQTLNHIKGLLQRSPNPKVKQALNSCARKYNSIIVGDVPQAIEALTKGDPKFAEEGANDAANEANFCEEGFSGNSPLTVENKLVHYVSTVAAAIAKILL
ncbi:cell wall / vacuolar inhibitor of fructosidase 1-like [Fagus crenata]